MQFQRLYVLCPPGRADDLDAAADAIGPGYLRVVRTTHQGRCVASLQATDAEALQLLALVLTVPGVQVIRGPDDDGLRPGDVLVDIGDPAPALPTAARYTWARMAADLGLTPLPKGPPP